ncbi:hypothetical protein FL857_05960 [Criibacterium bergeronii]|uniref:Rho termination factor N-terminal domain-containing protein n=1 Tax=Criibacterium bergeronii TaxID=1871336 RepID=A0A552V704_9FIRM|nr:hypothetical protein [Criibacterium bergeronii]TRW26230.1 hypothetical protein FL857_05960 [Criibacterium bergeronii]
MKVKSIRGSIKYNGTVYDEGQEFDIDKKDFATLQENIEVIANEVANDDKNAKTDNDKENQSGTNVDKTDGSKENEDSEPVEDVDLNLFKVDELKKIAEKQGIELKEKMTKAEMIKAIKQGK